MNIETAIFFSSEGARFKTAHFSIESGWNSVIQRLPENLSIHNALDFEVAYDCFVYGWKHVVTTTELLTSND